MQIKHRYKEKRYRYVFYYIAYYTMIKNCPYHKKITRV